MFPKSEVFVIESANFDEEDEEDRLEGEILCDILRLAGKEPIYRYLRTQRELEEILDQFKKSDYRYLHLSLHGNSESLATTLDVIGFPELGGMLKPYLKGRRLFVSACDAVNENLVYEVMPGSGCQSILGPYGDITFDDAAVIWALFYHLMFRGSSPRMRSRDIRQVLRELVVLFEIPVAFCDSENSSVNGLELEIFGSDCVDGRPTDIAR